MKKDIHPNYNQTTITCACGAVFNTGSTRKNLTISICSYCHPFYTGEQKFVDTAGRIEKFGRRFGNVSAADAVAAAKAAKAARAPKKEAPAEA